MRKGVFKMFMGIERGIELNEGSIKKGEMHACMPEMAGTRKSKMSQLWKKKQLN